MFLLRRELSPLQISRTLIFEEHNYCLFCEKGIKQIDMLYGKNHCILMLKQVVNIITIVLWRAKVRTYSFFPCGSSTRCWITDPLRGLRDHTRGHTTLGSTPLDEWTARRRALYRTTHNIYEKQTSTPLAGFEPIIPGSERPQNHALDHSATGIGTYNNDKCKLGLSFVVVIV
jgi:hypothetical protein